MPGPAACGHGLILRESRLFSPPTRHRPVVPFPADSLFIVTADVVDPEELRPLLRLLYGAGADKVAPDLAALAADWAGRLDGAHAPAWSQRDALLITYADSVVATDRKPLQALGAFLDRHLGDHMTGLHLLPFFPFTSDDGFSVVDYHRVRDDLGDWNDVGRLARDRRLAIDVVLNHASLSCPWIQADLAGDPGFADFAFRARPDWDLSKVIRPRTSPLFHEFDAAAGPVGLWTTFSRDQIDLNYRNPRVLRTMVDVMFQYIAHGASVLRLDAVPYLWKQSGTPCVHLPETMAVLQLLRLLVDRVAPGVRLLAETNAPFADNLGYWGADGRNTHWIYDFSVGPLLLHALATGDSEPLVEWAAALAPPGDGSVNAMLHVTATHDGIGVRPAEGVMPPAAVTALAEATRASGCHVSARTLPDGQLVPYELNITWWDAVNRGPADHAGDPRALRRYLTSQAVPLALKGVPGIYIHSLFGSHSDVDLWRATGHPRSVNRAQLPLSQIEAWLADPESHEGRVFNAMRHLLRQRQSQPALHPAGDQQISAPAAGWLLIRRTPPGHEPGDDPAGGELLSLTNFSDQSRPAPAWPARASARGPVPGGGWRDLLAGETFPAAGPIPFEPWQTRWLVAPAPDAGRS